MKTVTFSRAEMTELLALGSVFKKLALERKISKKKVCSISTLLKEVV